MIYWSDVRKKLLEKCSVLEFQIDDWSLYDIVMYMNKEDRLSMQSIADLTEGRCGRTALCLKMKELKPSGHS